MGIGYRHMGDVRRKLFEMLTKIGYVFTNFIHPSCVVPGGSDIGQGNILLESVIVEHRCLIGNGNLFFGGAIVGHDSTIGNFITMSVNSACMGNVLIKDNCFLGGGSMVRDHVTLNDHVLVGASALAYKDAPAYAVIKAPKSEIDAKARSIDYL